MKTKIFYITLLALINFPSLLFCQDSNQFEIIDAAVLKNILIYRIKYTTVVENNTNDRYLKKNPYVFDVLPDIGYKLKFDIKKEKIHYPDSSFVIYSLFKNRDTYVSEDKEGWIVDSDFPINLQNDNFFLIAINKKNEIKYLSGNFLLTSVIDDFYFNDSSSMLNYVKLKTFQYQLEEIKLYKKRNRKIIYNAIDSKSNKKIKVLVYKKDLEVVVFPLSRSAVPSD